MEVRGSIKTSMEVQNNRDTNFHGSIKAAVTFMEEEVTSMDFRGSYMSLPWKLVICQKV